MTVYVDVANGQYESFCYSDGQRVYLARSRDYERIRRNARRNDADRIVMTDTAQTARREGWFD